MMKGLSLVLVAFLAGHAMARRCERPSYEYCSSFETSCPKGKDMVTGCDLGSTCVNSNGFHNYMCPEYCPCLAHEMTCLPPNYNDYSQGCPDPPVCLEPVDFEGCPMQCPAFCEPDQIVCPGVYQADGCLGPDHCAYHPDECEVPMYDNNGCELYPEPKINHDYEQLCYDFVDRMECMPSSYTMPLMDPKGCPVHCPLDPVICTRGQDNYPAVVCPGHIGPDGCMEPEYCYEQPEPFCDLTCPQQCDLSTEQICVGGEDMWGCRWPYTCVPIDQPCPAICREYEMPCQNFDPKGNVIDEFCQPKYGPISPRGFQCENYCPASCMEFEQTCPGVFDDRGCVGPETCVPIGQDCPMEKYMPDGCRILEPVNCRPEEMYCSGGSDDMDCPQPDFCMPNMDGKGFCPPSCTWEEVLCPGPKDFESGMPMGPDFCIPAFYRSQKNFECTSYCPVDCGPDQLACNGDYDSHGCQGPPMCVPQDQPCPKSGIDANGCPIDYPPPKQCAPNERSCGLNEYDSNGCPVLPYCMPADQPCPESSYDSSGCLVQPPVKCDDLIGDIVCHMGFDDRGCDMGSFCMPREPGNCWTNCPIQCDPKREQICGGELDEFSCKAPEFCQPVELSCPPPKAGPFAGPFAG